MDTQVGQMFMIGFDGTETTPELRSFIREEGIGGVILFRRNIVSRAQVTRLVERLKEEAGDKKLLVAIDQEGGRVQRLPKECGVFPPMAVVGEEARRKDDPGVAYVAATRIAEALVPLGINLDFAPVLDVNTNPFNPIIGNRAFGAEPEFVATLAVEFLRGLKDGGIIGCGKHFPGHGDTDADSHLDLPLLNHTRRRFEVCEWTPFRAAIAAGVPMIMTAHLMAPNLDPLYPATISHYITTRVLRGELGFGGVIVTDDLNMAGIARQMPIEDAAVKAVQAGADIVLICKDMELQRKAIDAMKVAVAKGTVSPERVTQSLSRISNLMPSS